MALLQVLLARPAELPRSCRYTFACGVFYALFGLLTLFWPGHIQTLFGDAEFAGHEADLFRLIGMVVAVLGWLYLFGARTGGRQFVAPALAIGAWMLLRSEQASLR